MNKRQTIYLDNNATTPCAPEVVEAMLPYFSSEFANAASPHTRGRTAASAVAKAREQVAVSMDCDCDEIIFTSGATEANNLAILGAAKRNPTRRKIITTAIEHKSILEPCEWMRSCGYELLLLPVSRNGVANVEMAADLIDDQTLLVSVQGANNEIGTLQPVATLAEIARKRGALVHCDAAQMFGKIPIVVDDLCVDYASISAHKAYGPKGIGALFVRNGTARSSLTPVMFGGGQELGLRPGTLNVAAIVGFGEAASRSTSHLEADAVRIASLRNTFEAAVLAGIPGSSVNGANALRLPGTCSISISDIPADVLMAHTPTLCISNGSACASGSFAPSHVIQAIGHSRDYTRNTVRISIGRYNTKSEVKEAAKAIAKATRSIRSKLARNASRTSAQEREEVLT